MDIVRYDEQNDSEEVAVYSKLKNRKLTKDRSWNGKLD